MRGYFRFEEPRAIYKWQSGQSLPTVDNLLALSRLLEANMEEILVSKPMNAAFGPREAPGGPVLFFWPQICFPAPGQEFPSFVLNK